jgi:hypothetical protein
MHRTLLAILVVTLLSAGCQSDAQIAAEALKERQMLDTMYPPGMTRADVIARHGGRQGQHTALPCKDENALIAPLAGEDFARWCLGDCVVRGDPPVGSVDSCLAGSGFMAMGIDAIVVLYDKEDRVIRAYLRHVD